MTTLAFDRSERFKDQDGHLHVRVTNISKATVNPYYGREIPGYQELGLNPDQIYQVFRPPEELAKAAETFNNVRLLSKHIAVSATDTHEQYVAGSTGTDGVFNDPYLQNSLVIWRAEDIADVESREKCEISASYYYDPVLENGEYEGLPYTVVMRNIRGNHVALVEAGRAGPDVAVHDSMENVRMTALTSRKALLVKGAIAAHLKPKLLAGSTLAFDAALADVTRATWKQQKPKVLAAITAMAKPKLAKDATLDDLKLALDSMDDEEDGAAEDDEIGGMDEEEDETEEEKAARMAKEAKDKAKDKARDMKAKDKAKDAEMDDETEEERKKREDEKKAEDGKAMDAAISAAEARVMTRLRAATEARELVRPIIGSVSLAMDSAEAIYKMALDAHKVDLTGVDKSAYRAMVQMLPKPGGARPQMAHDAAPLASLESRFPALSRINAA